MEGVTVIKKDYCPYCKAAKALLESNDIPFKEIDVATLSSEEWERIRKTTGMKTVPQIFIGSRLIGGFNELSKLDLERELGFLRDEPQNLKASRS